MSVADGRRRGRQRFGEAGRILLLALVWAMGIGVPAFAGPESGDVSELSLDELIHVEVTTAARKEQSFFDVSAAVYVISSDDIKRSGATSIPEALRMAPGIEVARVDANKWAISARGFNTLYANKLLVLIDGRSVYSPLFSGVYWDAQDLVLEDVDRIEIIRGPGASLWGANAVNGIINIVTKQAQSTQGGYVEGIGGTEDRASGAVRYGGRAGRHGFYRVYGKAFSRDGSVLANGAAAPDGWRSTRAGFSLDLNLSEADTLAVQADGYDGYWGSTSTVPSTSAPFTRTFSHESEARGTSLLTRWERSLGGTDGLALQFYGDFTNRPSEIAGEKRETYDLDFQHRIGIGQRNDLVWGLGVRRTMDELGSSETAIFDPARRSDDLFSAFVQDDLESRGTRFRLTFGAKFEHNDYSGFEVQPNIRLVYKRTDRHSIWGAVSRSVRTPSRAEEDVRFNSTAFPFMGTYGQAVVFGDRSLDSEEAISYEAGTRMLPQSRVYVDVAVFYTVYNHLRTVRADPPFIEATPPPPHLVLPQVTSSGMSGISYGVEVAVTWQATARWRLMSNYSRLELDLTLPHGNEAAQEGDSPRNQFHVRSYLDLPANLQFNAAVWVVDRLDNQNVPGYVRLDTQLAWQVTPHLEASFMLQNILDKSHQEFGSQEIFDATRIQRSAYGKLAWRF